MAVRHGYGKIAGADALVFAYDTGDTRNSYKGEPTVNLAANSQTMEAWYGATSTREDAPEYGPGWKKVTFTEINGSNYRIAKLPYLTQPDGTTRTYSLEYDIQSLTGYFLFVDGTAGYPQTSITGKGRFSYTVGPVSGAKTAAIFVGKSGTHTGINEVLYYKEYQVEEKSHATPFVNGTRSATQGLLDLTGNRTIDLANVSFDSNSQVTFDGTNDYLSFPYTQSNPNLFSVETVFYHTAHSSDTNIGHILVMPYNGYNAWIYSLNGTDSKLQLRHHNYSASSTSYNVAYTTGLDLNKWYHTVATDDGTNVKLYVNGELVKTQASATSTTNGTMTCKVGSWPTSNTSFAGDIPVVKIYNRALTAAEVLNNFNNYKSRFNL